MAGSRLGMQRIQLPQSPAYAVASKPNMHTCLSFNKMLHDAEVEAIAGRQIEHDGQLGGNDVCKITAILHMGASTKGHRRLGEWDC